MKTVILAAAAMLVMTGCGSRVSGAIGEACIAADRKDASPTLCSCVQRAANDTLSGGDQSKAAVFFGDPQAAHDTRISNSGSNERFWQRYKAFSERAEQMCR